MTAVFEFRRSNYDKNLDLTGSDFPAREVVTSIGESGGNFFNWTSGQYNAAMLAAGTGVASVDQPNVDGDVADPTLFPLYPMAESLASVEVYLRGYWSGTGWSNVTGIKLFVPLLDVTGYGTGAWINGRIVDQYPTGDSGLVDGLNPNGHAGPLFLRPDTTFPDPYGSGITAIMQQSSNPNQGALDLTPGSGVTPESPASQYSRYAVLQLVTGSNPTPGQGGQSTFKLTYDES